jgi:hypothetical protein
MDGIASVRGRRAAGGRFAARGRGIARNCRACPILRLSAADGCGERALTAAPAGDWLAITAEAVAMIAAIPQAARRRTRIGTVVISPKFAYSTGFPTRPVARDVNYPERRPITAGQAPDNRGKAYAAPVRRVRRHAAAASFAPLSRASEVKPRIAP